MPHVQSTSLANWCYDLIMGKLTAQENSSYSLPIDSIGDSNLVVERQSHQLNNGP